jgi:glycosyltransferase involved in cell wall biosynthesis
MDGSVKMIEKYAARLAYWVSEADSGQSTALNKGLRHATGDIWAWMNADDAYQPGAVRQAIAWLDAHPQADIVYGDCLSIDENGQFKHHLRAQAFDPTALLTGAGWIPTGSTFLRRGVRDRIGDFDETLHYVMDIEYWFRAQQTCVFTHVPQPWSLYRVHPTAKTWDIKQSTKRAEEFVRIHERYWSQDNLPIQIRPLRSRSLANAYLYAAHLAAQADQRQQCLRYTQQSVRMGLSAFRPRLARLVAYLVFSQMAARLKRKLRASGPQQ